MISSHRLGAAVLGAFLASSLFAGQAYADAADDLVDECHIQLDLSDSGCACIGESARRDLSETQQEFVLAQVTDDKAASDSLMQDMTVEEMTQAAEWMMSAPTNCEQN